MWLILQLLHLVYGLEGNQIGNFYFFMNILIVNKNGTKNIENRFATLVLWFYTHPATKS